MAKTATKKKRSQRVASSRGSTKKTSRKKTTGKSLVKGSAAKNLPANWREELAKDAAEEAERIPTGAGNNISLRKNGQFSYQGSDIGDVISVVIVAFVAAKKYFDRPYDEDNPSPPACFALRRGTGKEKNDFANIAPHDNSPDKQAEICSECWANEWGSSGRKRAKACSDKYRLAVIHEDDLESFAENPDDVDIALLEVPPTSLANFRGFVKKLTKAAGVPTYSVITKISMDDDEDYQVLEFEYVEELPGEIAYLMKQKQKEALDMLLEPYDVSGYEPTEDAKPKRGGKKASSKKVGKKKRRSRLS